MRPLPKLLSKTKLMRGFRCLKALYLTLQQPELEAPITPDTQALFDQGNEVGAAARDVFPGGVLIDHAPWDFGGALKTTRAHIEAKTPILYEAAFDYHGCYARADILVYNPNTGRYLVYEVKSSTKLKPEHVDDVGLQVWIMAKSGLPIEKIAVLHINPQCRFPDLSDLFTECDVTALLRDNYLALQAKLQTILHAMKSPLVPPMDIGPYCEEPTACGFKNHCFLERQVPALSVFSLPGMRDRKWDLYYKGQVALDDIPSDELNALQARIIHAHQTQERFVDTAGIQTALSDWQFPLICLDFETINPAIPRFTGTGPYQQIPFQFSVHILEQPGDTPRHIDFLYDRDDDPRPSLIPALLEACGHTGSIVAYYATFESTRIRELAEFDSNNRDALLALTTRMVDPLPILRNCVYDPAFQASFSLKAVGPALLGSDASYKNMMVADGGAAQRAYSKLLTHAPGPSRDTLKEAMLAYCGQDTKVLADLVTWLYAVQ